MSFNDDFMDFVGFMTNGTGKLPEETECDEDLVENSDDDEKDGED